jgi:hypothetical protein
LVSIPSGVPAAAAVRCPLCDAEYALGEALALVPPELIPVSVPDRAGRPAEDSSELPPAAESETGAADAGPPGKPAADHAAEGEPTVVEQPVNGDEIAGEHEDENEAAAAAAGTHPMASVTLKRQRRAPSGLRRLIETLIGALVGFLIAYYAWAICLGPRRFQEEVIQRFGLPQLPFISAPTEPPAK